MISFWSVFSAFVWFALASLLLFALRRRENFLMHYGVAAWSIVVLLAVVRLLVPVDDAHMIILRSYTVLPALNRVLRYELLAGVTVERFLVILWLAGALTGLAHILCGLVHDRHRLRQLPTVPPSFQVQSAIQVCSLSEDIVCVTSAAITPMALGLLSPTICLPDDVYTETELCWILRHEAAHISGHDGWLRLGFLLFRCLFWWNPFVHWGQRSVDDILELRCDKAVLEGADPAGRVEYVESLYHVASKLQQDSPSFIGAGTFAQAGKTGALVLRAKQALETPRPHRGTTLAAITLSLALFVASYAFILQPAGFPPDMEDGVGIYQVSLETSYIRKTPSGNYELWCNGEYAGPISNHALNDEPYKNLEVHP